MPDLARIIAQHARTTELFGVDFVPLGDPPSVIHAPAQEQETVQQQEPEPDFADAPRAQTRSFVEPKASSTGAAPITDVRDAHAHLSDPGEKLAALRARYESDAPHSAFVTDFNNIVFGEGSASADLMFVGEAPGQQEDETGRPFVGRAGQLLDKMIVAMGFSRESVYICNVLKTRPPNNATPTSDEAAACAPYLAEQIRIIEPKIIVTLGLPASRLLLGTDQPMRSLRGRFHPFPPGAGSLMDGLDLPDCKVMPTYHPAFLLRSYTEENRRKVWSDLQQVVSELGAGRS